MFGEFHWGGGFFSKLHHLKKKKQTNSTPSPQTCFYLACNVPILNLNILEHHYYSKHETNRTIIMSYIKQNKPRISKPSKSTGATLLDLFALFYPKSRKSFFLASSRRDLRNITILCLKQVFQEGQFQGPDYQESTLRYWKYSSSPSFIEVEHI